MNPSRDKKALEYRDAGVLDNTELGLEALLKWVRRTEAFREKKPAGRSLLDVGFFASVIDLGHGLGLAICTDGVGTKVLIAELAGRYDTIGIDCVAMNVNDLICVGAEPVSMVDYIAIERATPKVLEEIGRGLHEGARQAGINIVGGEIAQIAEMIRGSAPGTGLDIAGMCVGLVPVDRILLGQDVVPGDVILGLRSSGIHSNGLTLARRALLEEARLPLDDARLGRPLVDELLEPTRIYVPEVRALLERGLPVKALAHVTSDGLLNLARIAPEHERVGFSIDDLPEAQPIFQLIQQAGGISDAEMYRVFNMGVGFCVIVPHDRPAVDEITAVIRDHGVEVSEIGRVVEDARRRVFIREKRLVGEGDSFTESDETPS